MKKIFKFLIITAVISAVILLGMSVFAAENIAVHKNTINITVDGERVFADNFLYEGTTYVPLRRIAEMFGKKVEWSWEDNSAVITDTDKAEITDSTFSNGAGEKFITIPVERNTINIYLGSTKIEADNFLYNGRTYVPLRKISEMLNKPVDWEPYTATASIGKKSISIFDGEIIGTVNSIPYTKYIYDYYYNYCETDYLYNEMIGNHINNPGRELKEIVEEYIAHDYAIIDYAYKNGITMRGQYHSAYFDSINNTLKANRNDEDALKHILMIEGYPSRQAYFYGLYFTDVFNQLAGIEMAKIYEDDVEARYNEVVGAGMADPQYYSYDDARYELAVEMVEKNLADFIANAVHEYK